jgi:Ca2+-binding RTX toxin-like protein
MGGRINWRRLSLVLIALAGLLAPVFVWAAPAAEAQDIFYGGPARSAPTANCRDVGTITNSQNGFADGQWCVTDGFDQPVTTRAECLAAGMRAGIPYPFLPSESRCVWALFVTTAGPCQAPSVAVTSDLVRPNDDVFDGTGACAIYMITDQPALCNGELFTIDMNSPAAPSPTNGNDVILGTPLADTVDGLGGDDTMCLGAGKDVATGGSGNDALFGEGGNDILRGQQGMDLVDGGNGNDRVLGGIDNDRLIGGDGQDFLGGFGGNDIIDGNGGDDIIFGGFGGDTIRGGSGQDKISGLIGNDTIDGGAGDDELNGDRGRDTIDGGAGNDTIRGGNSDDILRGGDGNDGLFGGKADDRLSGGPGRDSCFGNLENVADMADATCEVSGGIP